MNNDIIVTTGDISHQPYKILGPVYFQISKKGLFGSTLSKLKKQYAQDIANRRKDGAISESKSD